MEDTLSMEQVDIALTLTFEELAVLLNIMGVDAFAGFDREVLNQVTPEQQSLIESTARRGLIARQYISVEDGELKIEPLVLTLLTACVVPATTTVMVINRPAAESELHYLHEAEEVVVAHTPQDEGFHRFIWRRTLQPLVESALVVLDLQKESTIDCPSVVVSESVLTQAREAVPQGEARVQAVLQRAGVPQETAVPLSHSLVTARTYATLAHIDHEQDNAQDGWTLLEADNGLWLVQPVTNNQINEPVQIEPVTKLAAKQAIIDLLA